MTHYLGSKTIKLLTILVRIKIQHFEVKMNQKEIDLHFAVGYIEQVCKIQNVSFPKQLEKYQDSHD